MRRFSIIFISALTLIVLLLSGCTESASNSSGRKREGLQFDEQGNAYRYNIRAEAYAGTDAY